MPNQPPSQNSRKVLDAEIIQPENSQREQSWRGNAYGPRNRVVYTSWTASPIDQGGCAAGCVTLFLFLACLGQYGLLAAIGFMVFHVIGSIIGTVYQARQLMAGSLPNPWAWRGANWIISFLLTVWLAGGIND